LDSDRVRLVAHRGWSARFPENSLAAFAAALGAGADEIEFDVRHSKDGAALVSHDANVDRVSMLEGPCKAFTMAELKSADMVMADGARFDRMGFASLDEVLELFGGKIVMNIHVKEVAAVETTVRSIHDHGLSHEDCYIAGNIDVLERARALAPQIPRCCLAGDNEPNTQIDHAVEYGCVRAQLRWDRYDRDVVTRCKSLGILPNLYFADDPDGAERAIEAGIIALLTNDVGPIKKHLLGTGHLVG